MLNTYRYHITLSLLSPVLSQGLQGTSLGVDTASWQVNQKDTLYPALPGSLIRGNLLHSWSALSKLSNEQWMTKQQIHTYLGSIAESGKNLPNRSFIRSSEAWVADLPSESHHLHRIHINSATGAVNDGMLQTIQVPHPVGKQVDYVGWMEATVDKSEAIQLQKKIQKGLEYISALGAFKGVGFGELLSVKVPPPVAVTVAEPTISNDTFGIALKLDRPFCFAKPHPLDSNRFESEIFIPGGAIKGAIANRMQQIDSSGALRILQQNLHLIRFTHAHATNDGNKQRATVIPLSLYLCEQGQGKKRQIQCFDASLEAKEQTIQRSIIRFQSDWKAQDWDLLNPHFIGNQDAPEHTLRVRTAMEYGENATKDGALFSVESINTDQHRWLCNVSLDDVASDQRQAVKQALLGLLTQGLNGLGKTRAQTASIKIDESYANVLPQGALIENGQVRIMLQSDALLLTGLEAMPSSSGGNLLMKAYSNSWSTLSDKSLQLVNFFAKQSLYGGDYFWRRFRSRQDVYNPLVRTLAGSVFIFEINDEDKAIQVLQQWLQTGLQQVDGNDDWQSNPLLANNGYGEILVNPKTHDINIGMTKETITNGAV